jgi:Holliday junction resolvase-like predicted endonuclease
MATEIPGVGFRSSSHHDPATIEKRLLSGDEIEVVLEQVSSRKLIGIEVKSRKSNDADLIRGVLQCVKYQAILNATEDYLTSRDKDWIPRAIDVLFVTERTLPPGIAELAKRLGVSRRVVLVPDNFTLPNSTY